MTPLDKINVRASAQEQWLRENAPHVVEDQKHLDDGSIERAYWHYGYLVALRDVRKLLSQ
jgi:hypothetical protein